MLGDLDSYTQKNGTLPPNYTLHKNKLKMEKDIYKSQHHKSPTEEHRQGNLIYSMQQYFH